MNPRSATEADLEPLARIWYDGWRDAHADILPEELARQRTLESLRDRLPAMLTSIRTIGAHGAPLGFHFVRDRELNQLYVSREARGAGVAAALIADAEARLRDSGVDVAWLACAIGNHRAARFYEKSGWQRVGIVIEQVPIPDSTLPIEVWRYEKPLT